MLEKYNYEMEVKDDIVRFLKDNYNIAELLEDEDLQDDAYERAMSDDSVTGALTRSYYCSRWYAEEALAHNWDLIQRMAEEFGQSELYNNAETVDCLIRCMVFSDVWGEALAYLQEELDDMME